MRTIFILVVAVCCSGCSTIGTHLPLPRSADDPVGTTSFYQGSREDYYTIFHDSDYGLPNPVLAAIDFPFSLVGDTLFLPIDFISWTLYAN